MSKAPRRPLSRQHKERIGSSQRERFRKMKEALALAAELQRTGVVVSTASERAR